MEIELERATIHYSVLGEGIPVIIIHGFAIDHRLMKNCLEPIFSELTNYKRIYLDLPGMGKSKVKNINNADEMLECLVDFIHFILPNESFLLIGQSFGGYLSLGILSHLQNQINGLSLICPCIQPIFSKRKLPQKYLLIENNEFENQSDPIILKAFYETAVLVSEKTFHAFSNEIYPSFLLQDSEFLNDFQKNGYSFQTLKLKKYVKPTCFFAGKQDHIVGYEDLFECLDYFPRASFYLLDLAGHSLQIEQTEIFRNGMFDWLKRIELFSD